MYVEIVCVMYVDISFAKCEVSLHVHSFVSYCGLCFPIIYTIYTIYMYIIYNYT